MAEFEIAESPYTFVEYLQVIGIKFGHEKPFLEAPLIFVERQTIEGSPSTNIVLPRDVDPADIPALIAALQRAREIAEAWAAERDDESEAQS